jgi:hypothetical protein
MSGNHRAGQETGKARVAVAGALTTGALLLAPAGVAVGLAGPASAEPLSGAYSATAIEGGLGMETGTVSNWTLSPCGADCTHLHTGGGIETDLHLQDNVWTGPDNKGCFATLDNSSLVYTVLCPNGRIVFQLRKDT